MRFKVYLCALFFMVGLVVVDGYQDSAGHHDIAGASACQTTDCSSHMNVPVTMVTPVSLQAHPVNFDKPAVYSLSIVHAIFNPPKALA